MKTKRMSITSCAHHSEWSDTIISNKWWMCY